MVCLSSAPHRLPRPKFCPLLPVQPPPRHVPLSPVSHNSLELGDALQRLFQQVLQPLQSLSQALLLLLFLGFLDLQQLCRLETQGAALNPRAPGCLAANESPSLQSSSLPLSISPKPLSSQVLLPGASPPCPRYASEYLPPSPSVSMVPPSASHLLPCLSPSLPPRLQASASYWSILHVAARATSRPKSDPFPLLLRALQGSSGPQD